MDSNIPMKFKIPWFRIKIFCLVACPNLTIPRSIGTFVVFYACVWFHAVVAFQTFIATCMCC